jgi:AraC-like DNA-binding protein
MRRPEQTGAPQVAARVGYDAEAAFSRTFKRYTGQAPRAFRMRSVAHERAVAPGRDEDLAANAPAERRRGSRAVGLMPSRLGGGGA